MTLDDLAFIAARAARGERFRHPLRKEAAGMVCQQVHKMVYKLVNKYAGNCRADPDDMAQDCFKRITQRIGDFDPKKGKFTTWAWSVNRSVLNGSYRKGKPWNDHVVLGLELDLLENNRGKKRDGKDSAAHPEVHGDGLQEKCGSMVASTPPDTGAMTGRDIRKTVDELVEMYPNRKVLIMGLIGNPDENGGGMSSEVMLAEAARAAGISRMEADDFVRKVMRPFFRNRFLNGDEQIQEPPEPVAEGEGLGAVEAALTVMTEAGRPMGSREVFDEVVRRGLYVSMARRPYVSFVSLLGKASLRGEKRIEHMGVAMWKPRGMKVLEGMAAVATKVKGSGVVQAAFAVLRGVGRKMNSKELFEEAVRRNLYVSSAGNPYVSFMSVLGKALLKGESRIIRVGTAEWEVAA